MKQSIDEFEQGGEKLRQAVKGLSEADLKAFPVPGTWSIQQIVIHLQDSDLVAVDRMKRTIAEDNPLLIGYNETLFAQKLRYEDQSIDDAVTLLDLARKQLSRILRKLSPEAFDRPAVHNEAGKVTLGEQVKKYNWHLEHHLGFIRKKRAMLGK
jgi:DinB family protein